MRYILSKAMKEPGYAFYLFRRQYLKLNAGKKFFTFSKEFRADSEKKEYGSAIIKILSSQKSFNNFKKNYAYRDILEHVSFEDGLRYLDAIRKRKNSILGLALENVLQNDMVGNPVKYSFSGVNYPLSPTTLRYVKVASDLQDLFGSSLGSVAEIGCGYGGQAYINDQLLSVNDATLFDLPHVNKLIERYLNSFLFKGSYKTTFINCVKPKSYDLVISNYAFSEFPQSLQEVYIKKVLSHSKRGYLTMNSGLGCPRTKGKLLLEQLKELLPPFQVYEEEPLTSPSNYIIVWGHNEEVCSKVDWKIKAC